mmetsp:Transcript_62234/g.69636  ORF Transcript_62234/g.69636 Transcript_62234/m.69636 type:complete len:332 (+) Transcript_62234:106-1101(+)
MSTISRINWLRYFERVPTDDRGTIILPTNIIDDNDNDNNDDNLDGDIISTDTIDTTSILLATAADENEDNNVDNNQHVNTTSENEDNNNDEFAALTLPELEAARDDTLRQSVRCTMLGSFLLWILWLQALTTNNLGLLLLSILATFLFKIYIEASQERIDSLNQLLMDRNVGDTTTITIRRASSGVGEIVKQNWDTFLFNSPASLVKKEKFGTKINYNNHDDTLFTIDNDNDDYDVDDNDIVNELIEEEEEGKENGPECSICLGEYEKGDELVSLNPCQHVFHEKCISTWTNHNTRCPLCNVDLVNDLLVVQEQRQTVIEPSHSLVAANIV